MSTNFAKKLPLQDLEKILMIEDSFILLLKCCLYAIIFSK